MKSTEVIDESSDLTLTGSYTSDLILSKLWLAQQLQQAMQQQGIDRIPVAYVLGAWYGNVSAILRKAGLPIDIIVDVEKNRRWLTQGREIHQAWNLSNIGYLNADVNQIKYDKLSSPALVINTSTNDIADHGWFDAIPSGTMVVLQGRDRVAAGAEHSFRNADELLAMFPLEQVLYQGTKKLQDPETAYQRSMVIGIKGADQLRELSFLGSPCTKDCSGHRAGYAWSQQRGGRQPASWSDSFNRGAALFAAGK